MSGAQFGFFVPVPIGGGRPDQGLPPVSPGQPSHPIQPPSPGSPSHPIEEVPPGASQLPVFPLPPSGEGGEAPDQGLPSEPGEIWPPISSGDLPKPPPGGWGDKALLAVMVYVNGMYAVKYVVVKIPDDATDPGFGQGGGEHPDQDLPPSPDQGLPQPPPGRPPIAGQPLPQPPGRPPSAGQPLPPGAPAYPSGQPLPPGSPPPRPTQPLPPQAQPRR